MNIVVTHNINFIMKAVTPVFSPKFHFHHGNFQILLYFECMPILAQSNLQLDIDKRLTIIF